MFSVRKATSADAGDLTFCHKFYFDESSYREFTWSGEKTLEYFETVLNNPEFEVILATDDASGNIAGYAVIGFDSPFMVEEIAILSYFYIMPPHRGFYCSQMLLDFACKLCEHRNAKFFYASNTAGFPDNGVNERAFGMLLQRSGFKVKGSLFIREHPHDAFCKKSSEVANR